VTYLSALADLAAAPDAVFPIHAKVHGSVMGLKGRLQFQNTTGAPLEQYSLAVEVEDGTLATTAMLTHDVLMPFLGMSPGALQQASRGPEGLARVRACITQQQRFLATYTGVMTVTLPSPSADLAVLHLG